MMRRTWLLTGVLVGLVVVTAACGGNDKNAGDNAPVAELRASATVFQPPSATVIAAAPTQTPSGPTLTPSATVPRLITSTPTVPPPPPTDTPVPSATPFFREHVVRAGESCFTIAAAYGHLDPASMYAIQDLNGIRCAALQQGATIKVPLPTPTATEIGMDLTQTAVATSAPPQMLLAVDVNIAVQDYIVVEGDSLQGIAFKAGSTMRQICELNPLPEGLNCATCQWKDANCCCSPAPLVAVGRRLNVPAPSPTPTASPTFTGSETPTLTPTYRAPEPLAPRSGAEVRGAIRLVWLTVGALQESESYYVMLRDDTSGIVYETSTRQLSLDVPRDLLPSDGQTHAFVWEVQVVRVVDGVYSIPISQAVSPQQFTWLGWE